MILFVGDRPAPKAKTDVPFKDAACAKRLKSWFETLELKEADYKIINSSSEYFFLAVLLANQRGALIVALGKNASDALSDVRHFRLPHPSGRNRQINNKKFIDNQLNKCKKWLSNHR
jgi:uracil-DNA glycosylase